MIILGKAGRTPGSGLLRWIFGTIIILMVIAGINCIGQENDQGAEEPQQVSQQTGETDLFEAQVRAENAEPDQETGLSGKGPVAGENLTVHFIDVGQGDSVLLEYDGKTMLVDAGERDQGSVVTAYLQDQNASSIDYIVATHPHSDHIGFMG